MKKLLLLLAGAAVLGATVLSIKGFDENGKHVALFQLPCNTNITTATGTTLVPCTVGATASYNVWARALGKPGGYSTLTTCATDPTGVMVCSTNKAMFVRMKPNKFTNVTDALTSLVDINTLQTVALFQGGFLNFFWDYDNYGNKLLQLRFYLN